MYYARLPYTEVRCISDIGEDILKYGKKEGRTGPIFALKRLTFPL